MKPENESHLSNAPLYNSRIIKTYIQLLRKKYPHVNISEILEDAGITLCEVEDQGHWFTSDQMDRFYEELVTATGNKNLARDAGRYASLPESIGAIRYYVHSFSSPARFYEMVGNAFARFTRTVYSRSRHIGSDKVEVTVKPKSGITEKPYHCENRKGFFEAVLSIFNNRLIHIEHPECMFDGGSVCRYIISWNKSAGDYFRMIRNYVLIIFLLAGLFSIVYLPVTQGLIVVSTLMVLLLATAFFGERFDKRNLAVAMHNLQESSEQLVDQIDINYNNSLVTREIGQVVNRYTNLEDVLSAIVDVLSFRLDYDRGMLMLCDPDKKKLRFAAGFGYTEKQHKFLKNIEFQLDRPESRGVFVLSFREQKPFLINDLNDIEASLSPRSIEFARQMGAISFICSPIICDNESLGVIVVDNVRSKRLLLQSDMSLLVGVSHIIGISIRHTQHLEAREEQLHSVLRIMVSSIDARDPVTKGHSELVAEYSTGICEELGLDKEYREVVRVAALLHDYGKIGIPDALLKKNDGLTSNEYEYIKSHAEKTREILEQINFEGALKHVPAIAGAHHEKMDGNGYPRGLKGKDIPLGARIVAVADNFEALTACRYYNVPMPPARAIDMILQNIGTYFDGDVVEAFIRYYNRVYRSHQAGTGQNSRRMRG
ncbi:MAG: HD domain-containing protein [Desulfobacteraceae bacterium]|nr:HD domain-containing protein [Desulfobacteraceae bacterium]MCF8094204.1 HD domain-containing protein [Desulfobacteraceae bacterium]